MFYIFDISNKKNIIFKTFRVISSDPYNTPISKHIKQLIKQIFLYIKMTNNCYQKHKRRL